MGVTAKWAGSRQLLKRLRDVMAGGGAAQERLDKIVRLIARDMVAEVCSIYVRRAGDVLELFATEGLKAEAVHQTRLRVGEGIVGDIAANSRPTALADAQSHPNFAFRPETGEEVYKSMMGVPILRGGRVLGVVAVQNRTSRSYTDEEVEVMETIAMVIAELIASGEVVRRGEQAPADGLAVAPLRLDAVKLNGGLAMGRAVLHRPYVPVGRLVAEDETQEQQRLAEALAAMHKSLDDMVDKADSDGAGDHVDILKTYRMIAQDRGWIRRIREAVSTGLTAEGAVVRVQDETRARMKDVDDAYLRERLLDLEDLAYRLLQHLAGGPEALAAAAGALPEDAILVARNMGPAELLDYDSARLRGLVLEEGSATSHVAIVARALDIPVLGRVKNIVSRVEAYDRIIVDANNGVCFVRPGEDFRAAFETSMRTFEEKRETYRRERDLPSVTRDAVSVELMMNAGLLIDMAHLHESGASGVGLYRTEVPFMVRSDFPGVEAQTDLYAKIVDQAEGKEVVFRTLDIGGDKVLPYFQSSDEENPAMGWRAIRIAMDRPGLLRTQLRAMLRAAGARPLSVMFPMVAEVAEFEYARRLLMKEVARAEERGEPTPSRLQVGAMLEVPSLAFQIRALAGRADFLSIGSNDLMQFLFASDRGNPRLDGRYDPLSPPALGFLAHVVRESNAAGIPLSVCGEMAGDPLQAMALIGLGVRRLSMAPAAIGPVRTMVRSLDAGAVNDFTHSLLSARGHSLRARLAGFARDHGVAL
ncbi:MAG: phosphoenolpyruvate--protein phosphotransferase [Marivibrio sp.]|uniref:phosphoenolpyruvate--protein phosphotransferase n=1 Tax=Marivibrio sp. TaxID=2039719 RepID=UPI0032EB2FE6